MIISNILRKLLASLSFYCRNKKISSKKDNKIRNEISLRITQKKFDNKNLNKTHLEFNSQLLSILKNFNIKKFLRINFIQKMFFLHNRLFVFWELQELKKNRNWKFYQRLLIEDDVGDPIRYFLYPKSSGNQINHVYHLNVLSNEMSLNLKKNVKKIFEFGGGYGCMARIFSKINRNIKYNCFDTPNVSLLQYYYLKHNNLNVGFTKNKKIFLTSNLNKIQKENDLFIANWSLSEAPLSFRKNFVKIISKSKYVLISFQEKFEDIDNYIFFNKLRTKLSKKFQIKIIKNKFYKGNILFKQNHYYFLAKKL